uniref:Rab-GAP TBC domain-containing protein n=1 Tax=Calcidiscus leptoporus TaxID=127549 RepID=A0A7S0JJZ5_9EUKA|mmetsp:Transcript_8104/g.19021  ORF Transcript_8104/g.19021 Transcript_8104/m.19021 type:complete len:520 (+) Transcript_8104:37-1596(+)
MSSSSRIPPRIASKQRAALWRRCAFSSQTPFTPGYYARLLSHSLDGGVSLETSRQIEKDLHRTFGSVRGVRVPQSEVLPSLRKVLRAYAFHNPEIGYCQSMNFVAAVLLLVVDEEAAFYCLASVVEQLLSGHFSSDMAMSLVDQRVLRELLQHEEAELMAHLDELQVAPSIVTTQWLLTCFVASGLPLAALLRLWDCIFVEHHISFLFRVCCALFKQQRQQLLAASDTCEAFSILMAVGSQTHDIEALIASAYSLPLCWALPPATLSSLRQSHASSIALDGVPVSVLKATQAALSCATAADTFAAGRATSTPPQLDAFVATGEDADADESAGAERALDASIADQLLNGADCDGDSDGMEDGVAAACIEEDERGWTLVPMPTTASQPHDEEDEWSLVEREWAAGRRRCSLSYVILQLESPRLLEEYFRPASIVEQLVVDVRSGRCRDGAPADVATQQSRFAQQLPGVADIGSQTAATCSARCSGSLSAWPPKRRASSSASSLVQRLMARLDALVAHYPPQ